ncbi:MAG: ATP-binding protein [Gammaproteobacteria bacterium]
MVIRVLKHITSGIVPVVAMSVLLLVSLYLMSAATHNSQQFEGLYLSLLLINVIGLITLLILILANIARLIRQYRSRSTGSRITVRLVVMFVILAVSPVSVVFYFSVEFIQRSIDSWFDVRVEGALDDALELSRASLDARKSELLKQTLSIADALEYEQDSEVALTINALRSQRNVYELTLMSIGGHIISSSSADISDIVPNLPNDEILTQLRQNVPYVGLDTVKEKGLFIRIVVNVPDSDPLLEPRVVHALYPVSGRMSALADNVQSTITRYKQLTLLRDPLKYSFVLTLSLVLLLSLLTAVWAAFFSARRLVAPIRVLAIGTRAVAAGDYDRRLPLHSNDELGFLVQSFNEMTRKISQARDEANKSQQQAEGERAYLRAVLGRLSSGVMTLDRRHVVRSINAAARQILNADLKDCIGNPLECASDGHHHLEHFVQSVKSHLSGDASEWREEIIIFGSRGRQVLMCGGASLSGGGTSGGYVIVFEDVTTLVQAQRDAAWGEVARRLAHEIKNPLTPIQLSAERLRHKYLKTMTPDDAEVLDRSTHTIVQQVEVMKEMVKAFSDYARSPQLRLQSLDLNEVINEVLDLYRGDSGIRIEAQLDKALPRVEADSGRLRQLLHNLIKNSQEASNSDQVCRVLIATKDVLSAGVRMIELRLRDYGPGVPEDVMKQFFEPYLTTKPKGSGLGLAIVKKIVEEHSGIVKAENCKEGGVEITIDLPVKVTAKVEQKDAALLSDDQGQLSSDDQKNIVNSE